MVELFTFYLKRITDLTRICPKSNLKNKNKNSRPPPSSLTSALSDKMLKTFSSVESCWRITSFICDYIHRDVCSAITWVVSSHTFKNVLYKLTWFRLCNDKTKLINVNAVGPLHDHTGFQTWNSNLLLRGEFCWLRHAHF